MSEDQGYNVIELTKLLVKAVQEMEYIQLERRICQCDKALFYRSSLIK